jgi:hypothetical protein
LRKESFKKCGRILLRFTLDHAANTSKRDEKNRMGTTIRMYFDISTVISCSDKRRLRKIIKRVPVKRTVAITIITERENKSCSFSCFLKDGKNLRITVGMLRSVIGRRIWL